MVASGGTDLFVSGFKRYTPQIGSPSGTLQRIGIHSWAQSENGVTKSGKSFPKDDAVHTPYLDFYNSVCVSEDFYWKTMDKPVNPMYWLTEAEVAGTFKPWV